jgi:hypothetical protein
VVAIVRERLSVSKRAAQKFVLDKFYVNYLNDVEVKEQYQVKISNRFAALENLDDNANIITAWENTGQNMKASATEKLSYCELKKHKSWFDKDCPDLLDRAGDVNVLGRNVNATLKDKN